MSQSLRANCDKTRSRAGKTVTAVQTSAARLSTTPPPTTSQSQRKVVHMPKSGSNGGDVVMERLVAKIEGLEASLDDSNKKMDDIVRNTNEIKVAAKHDVDRLAALLTDITCQHKTDIDRLMDLLKSKTDQHMKVLQDLRFVQHALTLSATKLKKMEIAINDINNQSRLCNVKLDGKPEDRAEDLCTFTSDLANCLGASPTSIKNAYRLGKLSTQHQNAKTTRPRPILVVFDSITERNKFYFARTQLKDNATYRGVYINDDVSPLTHKWRDEFRSIAALARSLGSEVRVHGDGIIIDGTKYRHTDPDGLPSNLTLQKAKTVEINGGLFFHSEHAFMSNFHPSPIIHNDVIYPTAEHYFQAEKCRHVGDMARLQRVITAETPLEAKKVADQINETPDWRNVKLEIMKTTLDLKFGQNPQLAKQLLDTGDAPLHEATKNGYFGIGATLHSKELRDRAYKGLNKLGGALQELRDRLRNQ